MRLAKNGSAAVVAATLLLTTANLDAQLFENLKAFETRARLDEPTAYFAGPKRIATADFDKDGKPDIAISRVDGKVSVLFSTTNGNFSPPVILDSGIEVVDLAAVPIGAGLREIVAADFNGDGLKEIAAAAVYAERVVVFDNLGGGTFATARAVRTPLPGRDGPPPDDFWSPPASTREISRRAISTAMERSISSSAGPALGFGSFAESATGRFGQLQTSRRSTRVATRAQSIRLKPCRTPRREKMTSWRLTHTPIASTFSLTAPMTSCGTVAWSISFGASMTWKSGR